MLSSDVLKLHQGRSPFTAQRRAAAPRLDPRHAHVLQLQRDAGNRAVTQMVAAQRQQRQAAGQVPVQRALASKASDLGKHQRVLLGTYGKIIRVLADYEGARSHQEKMELVSTLGGLAKTWLANHQRPTSSREKQQREKVQLLEMEISREITNQAAQEKYLEGFDAKRVDAFDQAKAHQQALAGGPRLLPGFAPNGRGYTVSPFDEKKQFGGYDALSRGAGANAAGPARSLAAGQAWTGNATEGANKKAARLATRYQLTAAELAAVRAYTMSDYSYINPAMQNDRTKLENDLRRGQDPNLQDILTLDLRSDKNRKGGALPTGVDRARKEGAMHAAVMLQALAKLPVYAKKSYRGERMSLNSFYTRFKKGSVTGGGRTDPNNPVADVVFTRFGSASKQRDVASRFSHGEGDVKPGPNDTVSILCEIDVTNARDVSAISAAPKKIQAATQQGGPKASSEEEVLLLPGAKFIIEEVAQRPESERRPGRDPHAQAWYLVRMKQIE